MSDSSLVAAVGAGRHFSIGSTKVEVRISHAELGGAFGLLEFEGDEGPWTVPHLHRHGRESFYVIAGDFEFQMGDLMVEAHVGDFVTIAPNTVHRIRAMAGGGRLLAMVPGKLEEMFEEMSQLGPEALTDAETRRSLAARHDSVPSGT